MSMLEPFHFLRPAWLLAMPMLWLLLWLMRDALNAHSPWRQIVDPELLPHLSSQSNTQTSGRSGLILAALAVTLITLALAGPSWRQLPQPVYDSPLHRVLVMDLSPAMNAADIKPTRLARSKLLAQQLLNQQSEGDTALVAFSSDAFAVVPLTSDRSTVSHLLSSLSTDLMPTPGQNLAAGITEAQHLLEQGGATRGDIILMTSAQPDATARDAVEAARAQGFRIHVLAAGTEQGAPIPASSGGWQRDSSSAIKLARLPTRDLSQLARSGGGQYRRVDQAGADFELDTTLALNSANNTASNDRFQADQWQDEGPWLLLPLILIAALAFRRGWLFVLVVGLPLLHPQPALAGWWKTQDQEALEHYKAGEFANAADNFKRSDWRASALYEAGEFEQAAELWGTGDRAADAYNQGNALARAGNLEGALQAYSEALQRDPTLTDAQANRDLVEQLLQQQEQQQQNQQQDGDNQPQDGENSASQDSESGDDQEQPRSSEQQQEDSGEQGESDQQQSSEHSQQNGEPGEEQDSQQASEHAQGDDDNQQASASDDAQGSESEPNESAMTPQAGEFDPDDEQAQAVQQWLKRIPDDPGGLLRRKFERMQQRRQAQ